MKEFIIEVLRTVRRSVDSEVSYGEGSYGEGHVVTYDESEGEVSYGEDDNDSGNSFGVSDDDIKVCVEGDSDTEVSYGEDDGDSDASYGEVD